MRKPRVSVISTGDELVEPGQPLGPGQIRDSNSYSLATALIGEDAEIVWQGKAPDERDALDVLMRDRIAESDIVITSGGVSMGDLDLVKELLFELGTVHFQRLMMKPGKPLNFATAGDTLIFGLPGNPVSALAGFELFIRPALGVLSGRGPIPRPRVKVISMLRCQRLTASNTRADSSISVKTGSCMAVRTVRKGRAAWHHLRASMP